MESAIEPATSTKHRFYGLDFIKYWAFIAIILYHYSSVIWADYDEMFFFKNQSWIWQAVDVYVRALSNSGQTIVAVTAFLTGYHGTKIRTRWFLAFLVVGIVIFPLIEKRDPDEPLFDWDIYGLILVGFLAFRVVARWPKKTLLWLLPVFLAIASVPFWRFGWFQSWPLFIRSALVGDCVQAGGQWPLMPWLFFMLAFMICGRLLALREAPSPELKFSWGWVALWVAILAIAAPYMGVYFEHEYNYKTHCYLQTADPLRFWAHFTPVLFLGHLSLMDKVNQFLRPYLSWMQKSQVVSALWLPYFFEYLFSNIFEAWFGPYLRSTALRCFAGVVIIYILCEVVSYGIRRWLRRYAARSREANSASAA